MQLHVYRLIVCLAALAPTVVAMPHRSGPYHGIRLPVHVSSNGTNATTSAHNGTTTNHPGSPMTTTHGHGKNSTEPHRHDANVEDVMQCRELCTLAVETCVVAGPADKVFCGQEYVRCKKHCRQS